MESIARVFVSAMHGFGNVGFLCFFSRYVSVLEIELSEATLWKPSVRVSRKTIAFCFRKVSFLAQCYGNRFFNNDYFIRFFERALAN